MSLYKCSIAFRIVLIPYTSSVCYSPNWVRARGRAAIVLESADDVSVNWSARHQVIVDEIRSAPARDRTGMSRKCEVERVIISFAYTRAAGCTAFRAVILNHAILDIVMPNKEPYSGCPIR